MLSALSLKIHKIKNKTIFTVYTVLMAINLQNA